jgi:hypothetical protein
MKRVNCFSSIRISQAVAVLVTALVLIGCGPAPPQIVPVSGTVTLDGKPLPNAEIRFIPTRPGLDGNMVGIGVTDDDGKYTLRLPGKTESGCCACECKITVTEGPIPDNLREGDDQMAATNYLKNLKNRPIPKAFTRMADTPLSVTVKPDQTDYPIEISR